VKDFGFSLVPKTRREQEYKVQDTQKYTHVSAVQVEPRACVWIFRAE